MPAVAYIYVLAAIKRSLLSKEKTFKSNLHPVMKFQNTETYPILKIPSEISNALFLEPTHEEVFWSWASRQKHQEYSYTKETKTWTNHSIKFPQRVKPLETNKVIHNTTRRTKVAWGKLTSFILFGLLCSFFLFIGNVPFSYWFWFLLFYTIGFFIIKNEMFYIEKTTKDVFIEMSNDEILKERMRFNEESLEFKTKHEKYLKEIESDKEFVKEQLYWEARQVKERNHDKAIPAKSTPVRLSEIATRGKSEIYFLEALTEKFGQNIHCDLGLKAGNEFFKPDFVYYHRGSGLCVDIEVDEPYSFADKLPIHYKNYNDNSRDKYFLSQNWIVIRFTEKQIIESRQDCVDFIQECIHCVLLKRKTLDLKVKEEEPWTYEQGLLWAKANYRNSYLSKISDL